MRWYHLFLTALRYFEKKLSIAFKDFYVNFQNISKRSFLYSYFSVSSKEDIFFHLENNWIFVTEPLPKSL